MKFLNSFGVNSEYKAHYENSSIAITDYTFFPNNIFQDNSKFQHIVFYDNKLNKTITEIFKATKHKDRHVLMQFLSNTFDYVDTSKMTFEAKAVQITDITFTQNDLLYMEADIYGQHYLIEFNTKDNYKFIKKRSLWIY
jgi:hypothetical protein